MLDDVSIRPAGDDDVRKFVQDENDRRFLIGHLNHDRGIVLLAFREHLFAGHVFLRLAPAEEPELRLGLPGVPLLERLKVPDEHRGFGIGRHLIRNGEWQLSALGHRRVALGVHPDNIHAIRLYERLSFTVWREETLTTFRDHVRDDGSRVREQESCLVFVKHLEPPPP